MKKLLLILLILLFALSAEAQTVRQPRFTLVETWVSSGVAGQLNWAATNSGTGAATAQTANSVDATHLGVVEMNSGTTATGRTSLSLGTTALLLGGWVVMDYAVLIPTLSTSAERFIFYAGCGDQTGTGDQVDGEYVVYDESVSANWQTRTSSNSVRTSNTSDVVVNANQWYQFTIYAIGNTADFYIDGVLKFSHTTNLPTGAGRQCSPYFKLEKTVGTTARTARLDYFQLMME